MKLEKLALRSWPLSAPITWLVLSILPSLYAQAQHPTHYAKNHNPQWNFNFSTQVDLRLVQSGREQNWQTPDANQAGGFGLSRYGGDSNNGRRLFLTLPQAKFLLDVQHRNDFGVYVHLSSVDSDDQQDALHHLGLSEIFVHKTKDLSSSSWLTARAGLLFPPLSLEHTAVGWSTEYSLTPSAINTWSAEELRPTALELTFSKEFLRHTLRLTLAGFSAADSAGALLAWRGWALHDFVPHRSQRLRFRPLQAGLSADQRGDPFEEIDGRLGLYGKVHWNYLDKSDWSIFYWNSNGDTTTRNELTLDRAWDTEFTVFSLQQWLCPGFEMIAQWLIGSSQMGNQVVAIDYSAWYVMLVTSFGKNLFSLRFDQFDVEDKDRTAGDPNTQKGQALMASYIYKIDGSSRMGLEYLYIDGQWHIMPDPSDNLAQIFYRVLF